MCSKNKPEAPDLDNSLKVIFAFLNSPGKQAKIQ
jgi:hypothetical protein